MGVLHEQDKYCSVPLFDLHKPSIYTDFSTPVYPGNRLPLKLSHQRPILNTTTHRQPYYEIVFPLDFYLLQTYYQAPITPETLEPSLLHNLTANVPTSPHLLQLRLRRQSALRLLYYRAIPHESYLFRESS